LARLADAGKNPLALVNRVHLQIGQLNSARIRKAHCRPGRITLGIECCLGRRAFYLLHSIFLAVVNIIDNNRQPPRRAISGYWAVVKPQSVQPFANSRLKLGQRRQYGISWNLFNTNFVKQVC